MILHFESGYSLWAKKHAGCDLMVKKYFSLISASPLRLAIFLEGLIEITRPLRQIIKSAHCTAVKQYQADYGPYSFYIELDKDIHLYFIARYAESSFQDIDLVQVCRTCVKSRRDFIFFLFENENVPLKEALWNSGCMTASRLACTNVRFVVWKKAVYLCTDCNGNLEYFRKQKLTMKNSTEIIYRRTFLILQRRNLLSDEIPKFAEEMKAFFDEYLFIDPVGKDFSYRVILYGPGWNETTIGSIYNLLLQTAEIRRVNTLELHILPYADDDCFLPYHIEDILYIVAAVEDVNGQFYCMESPDNGTRHLYIQGLIKTLEKVVLTDGETYIEAVITYDDNRTVSFTDVHSAHTVYFTEDMIHPVEKRCGIREKHVYRKLVKSVHLADGQEYMLADSVQDTYWKL